MLTREVDLLASIESDWATAKRMDTAVVGVGTVRGTNGVLGATVEVDAIVGTGRIVLRLYSTSIDVRAEGKKPCQDGT